MLSPLFLRHYILNQICQRFKAAEFRFTKPNLLFSSSGMGISTIRFQLRKCQRKDACVHTDCTRFRCQQTVRGSSKRKKKVYPHYHFVRRPHTAYCDIITFIKHYLLIPRYRKKN